MTSRVPLAAKIEKSVGGGGGGGGRSAVLFCVLHLILAGNKEILRTFVVEFGNLENNLTCGGICWRVRNSFIDHSAKPKIHSESDSSASKNK